jgi:hypothetical protein
MFIPTMTKDIRTAQALNVHGLLNHMLEFINTKNSNHTECKENMNEKKFMQPLNGRVSFTNRNPSARRIAPPLTKFDK